MSNPIDELLAAIEAGNGPDPRLFDPGVRFDATVPNWRFKLTGAGPVAHQLGSWFRDPGRIEELARTPFAGGEVVRFVLSWAENGVPHACHQSQIITASGGRITSLTVFCGGRWPASLLAEMEATDAR